MSGHWECGLDHEKECCGICQGNTEADDPCAVFVLDEWVFVEVVRDPIQELRASSQVDELA